jgi:two-component sensor histidine kinase
MFKLIVTGIILCLIMPSYAQFGMSEKPSELILALQKTNDDSIKLQLLLQLSKYFYFEPTGGKRQLDSAFFYLQQAQNLSEETHLSKWNDEILCFLGKYYSKIGKPKQANECLLKIEDDIKKIGNIDNQVLQWKTLAFQIPIWDTSSLTKMNCLEKVVQLYQQSNNLEKSIEAQKNIADEHLIHGQFDRAEVELLEVLKNYKAIHYRNLHYTYDLLSVANRDKGDFNKAIFYGLKTIESMEATHDTVAATTFYSRLANMYRELDQPQNSVKWYWKVFRERQYSGPINLYMFRDAGFLVRELIKLKMDKEALAFILDIAHKNKPIGVYAEASLATTLAYCYHELYQDDRADKYYLEAIELVNKLENNNEVTADVNYDLGQFYIDRREYRKAAVHLQKALDVNPGINSLSTIKDIQLKLYNADSAEGNYLSAIDHLRKYQAIKDSVFNETKSRQIAELEVQYETSQREKDIQLLNDQNQLEQNKVEQANKTRNITFAGAALLLVIVSLLYNRYRLKQRTNAKLQMQQKEIGEQNISLRHLVNEKDWLVKEIHHRVKNNFQTVMGLLGTQSGYLKNEVAINAITDSQHRVHAMSLIHKKLYQTENLSTINMPDYIHELVDYLIDSFTMSKHILLNLQIEGIELDLAHCIPLGLILNEAITNSLKYAFPNDKEGIISISFGSTSSNHLLLAINDNGIGLPSGYNVLKPNSMGMNLMRGLSEEIGGQFSLNSQNGTQIAISFIYDPDVTIGIRKMKSESTHSI